MGICYPFRFRRDPEPARATLTIAAADTLDPASLVAVREGSGQRIAIVGSGEACAMRGDRAGEVAARAGDLGTVRPDTACRYAGRAL